MLYYTCAFNLRPLVNIQFLEPLVAPKASKNVFCLIFQNLTNINIHNRFFFSLKKSTVD